MNMVALQDVATINPRSSQLSLLPTDPVCFVPMAAVSEQSRSIEEVEVRPYSEVSKGYTYFEEGDVIVAKITPCYENGKIALARDLPHRVAFGSTEFHVFRASEAVDNKYIFHLLQTPAVRTAGASQMKGAAGQKRVPADYFKNIQIPLPPLAEQKRIAAILDAADALRAKRRESLAQLDTLLQSTFLDMFGDPVTNPKGLPKETLKTTFMFTTGKLDSNAAVDGGSYPFFTCARETFAIDEYAFDCEALLLAGNNANADYSVKHYKGKFNAYQRTYVISVDERKLTYRYAQVALEYMLADLKRSSKGSNTKYLTMTILNAMPIIVPPLDLQRRFATVVDSIEQQKARLRDHLAELDTLFSSLQQRAFNGEL